jgi:hypothetical protein
MVIRKEKENYILDAHDDDQRPKDKRHDAIDIRFRQGDGMTPVKAFLEGVQGACPNVAKNYTQGADNQYKGCIFEGMVIGFRVGGGKIVFIEKWRIQGHLIIRASEKEHLSKDLYLPRQIFLFPVPIEIAMQALKRLP